MRAPAFWRRSGPIAALLGPLGRRVGAITAAQMNELGVSFGVPVICVGNLVAGGAGKTPTAIWLAGRLAASGETPILLSRGYGGRLEGPLAVDLESHSAEEVGDEPLLLARAAPTIVARDRVAGAALAVERGATVIILDDGFQNPSLAKDFSLVVVDGGQGIGNGRCLPAGPLRAPLDDQLRHAHAVMVIGDGAAGASVAAPAEAAGLPVFRGRLAPGPETASLAGRRVLAVAGLGRPEKFEDTLRGLGAEVVRLHPLADHALPTDREAAALIAESARSGAAIVTTEKDAVKWRDARPTLFHAAIVVRVSLAVEDDAVMSSLISSLSTRKAGAAGRSESASPHALP